MSRVSLAEAINAHVRRLLGHCAGIDAGHVGVLERGDHRRPQDVYCDVSVPCSASLQTLARLHMVLGVARD